MSSCCSQPTTQANCCSTDEAPKTNVYWKLATSLVIASLTMMFGLGTNISPIEAFTQEYWIVHGGMIGGSLLVILLLGPPLIKATFKATVKGKLTIEGLFFIGCIGALVSSLLSTFRGHGAVYYEVVAVVLAIYTTGQLVTSYSRTKALAEVKKLKESFDKVFIDVDGTRTQKKITEIQKGDIIAVSPGEPISVDGTIIQGEAYVKETAITGELTPSIKSEGSPVYAGSYSVDGTLQIKVTTEPGKRQLDELLHAIEDAEVKPSQWQEQANQIMQYFLPFVIFLTFATFIGWYLVSPWEDALFNSMSVLLIACPCALGLATPIAIWSGLWKLSRFGLVARSGDFLNSLAKTNRLVFDKTGTLSKDELQLTHWLISDHYKGKEDLVKTMICVVEKPIDHPLAHAFLSEINQSTQGWKVVRSRVIPGQGIEAQIQKEKEPSIALRIGEKAFLCDSTHDDFDSLEANQFQAKKAIYISINDQAAAIAIFEETLRENTQSLFKDLSELGIQSNILTGDSSPHWEKIEGITVQAKLSPQDKLSKISEFKKAGDTLLFIGDGINDAPAMAECPASIAMGNAASLTQSTATAILKSNSLEVLPKAIKMARKIRKSIQGNLIFAASYNLLGMGLAAAGKLHPVVAALIMLVSSVFVSVRAVRSAR